MGSADFRWRLSATASRRYGPARLNRSPSGLPDIVRFHEVHVSGRVGLSPKPFPIRVTRHHFPEMLHVGDITKLNGALLPPVDIICGGSPCQD